MGRYEVKVTVTYKVDAESDFDAMQKIVQGAEFPVVPYDENTYCSDVAYVGVKEIKGEQK